VHHSHLNYNEPYTGEVIVMPVHGDFFKFAFENLAFCPTYKGVFSLHDGDDTIYIGKADGADGLRGQLQKRSAQRALIAL